jgi:hypothetical protein
MSRPPAFLPPSCDLRKPHGSSASVAVGSNWATARRGVENEDPRAV